MYSFHNLPPRVPPDSVVGRKYTEGAWLCLRVIALYKFLQRIGIREAKGKAKPALLVQRCTYVQAQPLRVWRSQRVAKAKIGFCYTYGVDTCTYVFAERVLTNNQTRTCKRQHRRCSPLPLRG